MRTGSGTGIVGARKVLTPRREWRTPILFGVLNARSRLACHLQWYLAKSAANIAHGLTQAMQKRGLPRSAMSDNGSAMTATEISEGLGSPVTYARPCGELSLACETTRPTTPRSQPHPASMSRLSSAARYRQILLKGTPRDAAQIRAASVRIFSRSGSRNAKLPNDASAACCRRSFSTIRSLLLSDTSACSENLDHVAPLTLTCN